MILCQVFRAMIAMSAGAIVAFIFWRMKMETSGLSDLEGDINRHALGSLQEALDVLGLEWFIRSADRGVVKGGEVDITIKGVTLVDGKIEAVEK